MENRAEGYIANLRKVCANASAWPRRFCTSLSVLILDEPTIGLTRPDH
jgi:hypothetical protein